MNKNILLFFVCVIVLNPKVFAQINLVPNPSFEVYDTCPYNDGQINFAQPWFQPFLVQSSTDYFNSCDTSILAGVPLNWAGNQFAHTGMAYAGFSPAAGSNNNGREYLEVQLLDTLEAGKKYCVSFYVSFAENSNRSIDVIGADFSNNQTVDYIGWYILLDLNQTPLANQIENPSGNVITDSINWTLIQGDFIANGGERYMTIGNFNWGINTTIVPNPNGTQDWSYYYIDDVSVVDCDSSTGLNELSNHQNNITIFPNPSNTICTITATSFKNATLTLYDLTGRVLLRQKFNERATVDVGELKEGIYVVEVRDKDGRSLKGKLLKD